MTETGTYSCTVHTYCLCYSMALRPAENEVNGQRPLRACYIYTASLVNATGRNQVTYLLPMLFHGFEPSKEENRWAGSIAACYMHTAEMKADPFSAAKMNQVTYLLPMRLHRFEPSKEQCCVAEAFVACCMHSARMLAKTFQCNRYISGDIPAAYAAPWV